MLRVSQEEKDELRNEFVRDDQAKLLKVMGYNGLCFAGLLGDQEDFVILSNPSRLNDLDDELVTAVPLIQQALDIFRADFDFDVLRNQLGWVWHIKDEASFGGFATNREGELALLDKLIELHLAALSRIHDENNKLM